MRAFVRLLSWLLLILVAAAWAAPSAAAPSLVSADAGSIAGRVVELVNQERVKAGLVPLRWNDTLAVAGTAHAQDMAARNYFAHNSPEGSTPVERARKAGFPAYGWGGLYVGENLARGFATAGAAMRGWLASESHRVNLLHAKYRETGVGVAVAPNGAIYIAQEFGSRPNVLPVYINNDAPITESAQVQLLVTSEDVSGWGSVGQIAGMMVSNRPDFAGAGWEPYSRIKPWTLSGQPGASTVFVRLRDAKGAVVETSDAIQFAGHQALAAVEAPPQLTATITTVWPRDGLPVAQATKVNVTALLRPRDSGASVPVDFSRPVYLLRSLNGGTEEVVAMGQRRVVSWGGDDMPVWDFNQVDVSQVVQPGNNYRFRVAVEGADTQGNVWDHHQ